MFRKVINYIPKYNITAIIYQNSTNINKNCNTYTYLSTNDQIKCIRLYGTQTNLAVGKNPEREFLVKLKTDPDSFGHQDYTDDELYQEDLKDEEYHQEKPLGFQKLSTKQYADVIKGYLRNRKLKEAIDLVEIKMIKEDRVKPENYIYNLLIGGCGRVGYTKKAFSLYNEMKRRGLKVTPGTYTALFNSCANSPWPTTDGLSRATHLLNIIREKMYIPNISNYNAMIKAFGRGEDLSTAFGLVDEMYSRNLRIKDDTLNFLLQACISDKEAGFRHALLVWRKFIQKSIQPSLYTYNLLLRCIRDCGLGDINTTKDVINELLSANSQGVPLLEGNQIKLLPVNNDLIVKENKPNLMAKVPHLGNILKLSEVLKPEDRLLLVGGSSGFLQNMADYNCAPDIKTFTQLLDNIPQTKAAEDDLLQALKSNKVKPDIDFFNMLIKKRSSRFDYDSSKEVLKLIESYRYRPNLITYGVLAIGCKNRADAVSLIEEMTKSQYRINIEILGGMLTQASHHNNFDYVLFLMETCLTEGIKVSPKFMQTLEGFKKKTKLISNDSNEPLSKSNKYQKGYKMFKLRYKEWWNEVHVDNETIHPWQQFRQTTDTDLRHFRDKEVKSHFKPVHNSLFKQTTTVRDAKVKK